MRLYGTYDVDRARSEFPSGLLALVDGVEYTHVTSTNQCEGWIEYAPRDRDGQFFYIKGGCAMLRRIYGVVTNEVKT